MSFHLSNPFFGWLSIACLDRHGLSYASIYSVLKRYLAFLAFFVPIAVLLFSFAEIHDLSVPDTYSMNVKCRAFALLGHSLTCSGLPEHGDNILSELDRGNCQSGLKNIKRSCIRDSVIPRR